VKILFLSVEYPPETPDGIGSYVAETAAALAARGNEVHVLSCLAGQAERDYRDAGVWLHRRGETAVRGLRRPAGERTAARLSHALTCRREVARLGIAFDVVETPDWLAEGLLLALERKPVVAQLHTPLAVTARYGVRGLTRDARWAARIERVTVERSRLVISPSELLVRELRAAGWLRRSRVRVIRFPVDSARWASPVDVADTEPIVAFAGRLEPLKAPQLVVDAVALLAQRGVEVTALLAGRSAATVEGRPYAAWLEDRIAAIGAPCRLLGQIPRGDVAGLFEQARVVVVPSLYENFPYAALEAMAAGRPVVCTSNQGIAELLDGSGAGAVVAAGDAVALADALEPYLRDAAVAARAGALARALVIANCDPERIAAEREECYAAVAAR
jgi:glycosyltransferase involved in cell wall biosynthesis